MTNKGEIEMKTDLTIIARLWFQKMYGNTYHSCEVYLNGELVGKVNFRYGYGRQYMTTAYEILAKAGKFEESLNNFYIWINDKEKVNLIVNETKVQRKKDL